MHDYFGMLLSITSVDYYAFLARFPT